MVVINEVADIKTVMITRQTTSPVLFRQMIGRALRGKKAGGKDNANKERKLYDIDEFVKKNIALPGYEIPNIVEKAFYDVSMPWKSLYKTEKNLLDAYFNSMKRISMKPGKTYK